MRRGHAIVLPSLNCGHDGETTILNPLAEARHGDGRAEVMREAEFLPTWAGVSPWTAHASVPVPEE